MKSKPMMILFSVAVAFTLWLYVITTVSPDSTKEVLGIEVTLDGESILAENNLMLISDTVPTVRVNLEGNRSDLVDVEADDLIVVADLAKIKSAGTHQLTYSVTTPGNAVIQVLSTQPETISVQVVEKLSTKVPVSVSYTGSLPEGYIMDRENAVLSIDEVTVEGPKEVVEQIASAVVEINCDGRTETIVESQRFKLCDAQGNPLDVSRVLTKEEEIRVEVRVAAVKKINLDLTVNDGGGATRDSSSIVIDPAQITVSGSEAALGNLETLILGTVNLADITASTEKTYEITLPEGIRNESGLTSATVKISFPELSKREFTITNFKIINVAEGMEAELLTKQLVITVRGPKAQVDNLRLEEITVELDLEGVLNSDTISPKITFGESSPNVGVLGKPTVAVTVAEPSTEETSEG